MLPVGVRQEADYNNPFVRLDRKFQPTLFYNCDGTFFIYTKEEKRKKRKKEGKRKKGQAFLSINVAFNNLPFKALLLNVYRSLIDGFTLILVL